MPDLLEHVYSAQQINIPPNLPFILKQYAKAAIRTQPYDLLYWSAAYFKAKANNTPPPVKERLEYPPVVSPSRLSPGFLKVLHKQLGENEFVVTEFLYEKWLGVCLVKEALDSILKIGNITDRIPWLKFVALAAGHLCPSLKNTMVMVCEVLTEEPDGGSAMIPVQVFVSLYEFLARLDCGPQSPHVPPPVDSTETTSVCDTQSPKITDTKRDSIPKVEAVSDKDSTAGLMVWEDVKPLEKEDRVQTPKYSEEIGASSEVGIEVLDNAKGPVMEVITIYTAQSHVQDQSVVYTPSFPSRRSHSYKTDENGILSHSSLKENEDWIKIETQKFEEETVEEEDSGIVESSMTATSKTEDSDQIATDELEKASSEIQEKDLALEGLKAQDDKKSLDIGKKSTEQPVSDAKENGEEQTVLSTENVYYDSKVKESTSSQDSILEPGETVTVQQFIKDNFDKEVEYSTAEIRKGVYGDESDEKIERASSENTVKEAETVYKLTDVQDTSSEFITHEKESDEKLKGCRSPTDQGMSQEDSKSFDVLPSDQFWQHVPGIGPVIPEPQILAVVEYMQYWASKQQGMVMPRNINHMLCPPLDLPSCTDESENNSLY